jgi:hypothetical protein
MDQPFADDRPTDARGLDPTAIIAEQQARVARALEHGPPDESRAAVRDYLDVEDRIIFDTAERAAPSLDDKVAAARANRAEVLRRIERDRRLDRVRDMFDRHVRETDGLFRSLWAHLDETARDDVAGALEEARLSREEADTNLPTRPDVTEWPG